MIERLKNQSPKKIVIMMWNLFRMFVIKMIHWQEADISMIQNLHPSTEIAIGRGGTLHLSHSVFTRKNVCFRVGNGGRLSIGTSFFNQGCCLTALENIVVGNDCLFGPNVVMVDHDHDYTFLDNQRGNHYKCAEVVIGNNVWIGGNVTILKGTRIGDNCVIGAGCVVKGEVVPNTVVYAKQDQITKDIRGC